MPPDDHENNRLRELLRSAVAEVNEKERAQVAASAARGLQPDDPAATADGRRREVLKKLEDGLNETERAVQRLRAIGEKLRAELAQHPDTPRGSDGVPFDPALASKHQDLQRVERMLPTLDKLLGQKDEALAEARAFVEATAQHEEARRKRLEALLNGARVIGIDTSDLLDG